MDTLIEAVFDAIATACAPIFVCKQIDTPPDEVDDNGTCGFVDTGEKRLLITAHHVIESFRKAKETHPEAVLAINVGPGNTIALDEISVIDEDAKSLDVAILEFPHLTACGHPCTKQYFPVRQFPIPEALKGEAISLVGYPGILRKGTKTTGQFSPVEIGYTITSVSDRQIILADEHGDRITEGERFQDGQVPLGGFSGSPGYIIRNDGAHLAGFLRAGSKEIDQPVTLPGVIFLSQAHYLNPNGTFDRLRMPWTHC